MPQSDLSSLWNAVTASGRLTARFLSGSDKTVFLSDLVSRSSLGSRAQELRGKSVLIATADQLTAALALLELDGIARRLVLWPADLAAEHLPFVIASIPVDAIVSDGSVDGADHHTVPLYVDCNPQRLPAGRERNHDPDPSYATEWILLTSGTTGRPKMVAHTLASLCGAIEAGGALADAQVWSTFYDIRRYGGLQIFLRAMLTGGSMVLSSPTESTAEFLARVSAHNVSHISGTPSHWRKALMSHAASKIAPQYVRLSGEIADQAILDNLHSLYPDAKVAHAFASTEAGVAFDVRDGLAGFPATLLGLSSAGVEMKVEDGSLRIRSGRVADRYIQSEKALAGADGFVDTGDMLELRDDRYYFVGRRDGIINVGGQKIHPEEVEGVINQHPRVRMSLVRSRKNPLIGALVVADVVLKARPDASEERSPGVENEILQMCRQALPGHKVPASIKFVNELAVTPSGKIVRQHA
jgi:acyl-coenzyme A synthetase/AMP-(fatty) acid ligase